MNNGQGRLIVVSNRLPVNIEGDGALHARFAETLGEMKSSLTEAHESEPVYP